ncbi:MAG: hypothetical protein Q4D90_02555 [bacterium]|nr:hypothetical protein [bacterium]
MLNEIMDAVTRCLDELFEGKYAIYTDEVEQGGELPCFFVAFLKPSEKPMIGKRAFRQHDMVIHFFQEDFQEQGGSVERKTGLARERNEVADTLIDGMEYITLEDGDLLRGTDRHHQVTDDVLQFFVSYNCFVYKGRGVQEESMETLSVLPELKKEAKTR